MSTSTPPPFFPQAIVVRGTTVQARMNAPLMDVSIGSFLDPASLPAYDYQTVIDWGDGSLLSAPQAQIGRTHASGQGAQAIRQIYLITGSHTYAAAGTYPINITITSIDGRIAYLTSLAAVTRQ